MAVPEVFPLRNGQHFENQGGNVQFQGTATNSTFNMHLTEDRCLKHLRVTDPRDDKIRIEQTKGGLLKDSYRRILNDADFRRWRDNENSRLLWIKGDPGKGKTMLLCGIIDVFSPSTRLTDPEADCLLSYFFCQATDSRINNATAVLRGLIYLLVYQQPPLLSHVRKKYDCTGKALFEDVNAWAALSDIFTNILQDPGLENTFLIVDALDECAANLPLLLDLITRTSSTRVKWIVSSRNWPQIEEQLYCAGQALSLELNAESVSAAVDTYIRHEVLQLAQQKRYSAEIQDAVQQNLSSNANGTFLWVALVCQNLGKIPLLDTLTRLQTFPPGLDSLYERMIQQVYPSEFCTRILALMTSMHRPVTLDELKPFVSLPYGVPDNLKSWTEAIGLCGSFLTLRNDTIYFVHQSAKDFVLGKASPEIFPRGTEEVHRAIFSGSLELMTRTLQRDMYHLCRPGFPIEQVRIPTPDPLAVVRYSCVYWIEHLVQSNTSIEYDNDIQDGGRVDAFLRQKYLNWLESLSLLNSISEGVLSMFKLQYLLQGKPNTVQLSNFVRDTYHFLMYFKWALENNPLQAYASALVFSPACSLTKYLFKREEPKWIAAKPGIEDDWSPCRQTLEGHSDPVNAVAFSPNGLLLASASFDKTVKLWDAATGQCRQTLKGHSSWVFSIAFSPDGSLLVSASADQTVKLWDVATGQCCRTLKGHRGNVYSVAFSRDGSLLVSAAQDHTFKLWDAATGQCRRTLEGGSQSVNAAAFSPDGALLASASGYTVKLWDAATGQCRQTLKGHSTWVDAVAFSRDSSLLVSGSRHTVKLWDVATGQCRRTLKGHSDSVNAVAFSPDGALLTSASGRTIKLWDAATGQCRQTLKWGSNSVVFSPDGTLLASASGRTVKLWDAATRQRCRTLKGGSDSVFAVAFSWNDALLALASSCTIKLWDAVTGQRRRTLKGHSDPVNAVAFSPDGTLLVSASRKTIKLWDTATRQCRRTLKEGSNSVNTIAFSPDGLLLASASGCTIKLHAATGQCRQTLKGHSKLVNAVAFSPDGTLLVSASCDNTIKLWDTVIGQCCRTLKGHSDPVNAVAFSPDSTLLASASYDKTIKLWDAATGQCQTLSIGIILSTVSFDTTSSCLYTNIGTILLDSFPSIASNASWTSIPSPSLQQPCYRGYGVSSDKAWITWHSEKLLWLPSEYRPVRSAIAGSVVALGCSSGRVLIFRFSAEPW